MVIKGHGRLRSIEKQMGRVPRGTKVIVGLASAANLKEELIRAGFHKDLVVGQSVLPTVVGPVTRFNAEGREIVHKDKPKETAYRQVEWTHEEWHGRYTETVTSFVDIPYQRYQRTFVEPPGREIALSRDSAGELVVISEPIEHVAANDDELLRMVNLFGELFGEASILTTDLEPYTKVRFKRLNWDLLPPGQHPWEAVQRQVKPIVDQMAPGTGAVVTHRLEVLTNAHHPSMTAIGRAGFSGYIVFGYEDKKRWVLESLEYGNATYVFDEDWETLSQMTKAQIIRGDLHIDRIVHREGWESRIRRALA